MRPAQQRFHADHLARAAGILRLVAQLQQARFEVAAQVAVEARAALGREDHFAFEHGHVVAAVGLGAVQGGVGVAEQFAHRVRIVREHAGADARGGRHFQAFDLQRLAQVADDALAHAFQFGRIVERRDDDGEFVAADAADAVAGARRRA